MVVDISIAQFRPVKASPAESLERVGEVLREIRSRPRIPRLLLFPETALTGYFMEGGVREHALEAEALLAELQRRWMAAGAEESPDTLDVAIGFYELYRQRVHNSALYARLGPDDGRILHVHRKVFLPTYGVFQEERFVESGGSVRAFDTGWGRVALLICEDAFHSITATMAALDGAQLVLVPSASPARGAMPGPGMPGNLERWNRLARGIAEEHGLFVAVSQLVGFEGGKGFPGGSTVVGPAGQLLARGPLWDEAVVDAALDMEAMLAARVNQPLLADLERMLPRLLTESPMRGRGAREGADGAAPAAEASAEAEDERASAATSFRRETPDGGLPDPSDSSPLEIDAPLVTDWLVRFLREEVRRRRGFQRVVVGLSGGVDSSLTAALCARSLGPDAVHAFLMPSSTSSPESVEDAEEVAATLGIHVRRIDIGDAVAGYVERHEPEADPNRRGNVMARERMIVLFDQAAKLDALPVGTGNKSERLFGYFTWHADDSAPINPLGDLFKTQVWALARHVGIPERIVGKPASADLIRGQTDEGDLGITYPEADLILHYLLVGYSADQLERYGFDPEQLRVVQERLDSTHWKRHLPTVAMLSATAIGEWYLRPVDY